MEHVATKEPIRNYDTLAHKLNTNRLKRVGYGVWS